MDSSQLFCRDLPRKQRGRCKRSEAKALQLAWLNELTWGSVREHSWQVQLWLGIFPVHWRQLPDPRLLQRQLNTIRAQLNGSYEDLLMAMVHDPALQISLNGPANHRRNPNENFARELLELFSLGVGAYSEADVRSAARALTGFRLTSDLRLELVSRRHDSGPKTLLGRTEPFDAVSLVLWLVEQPATAEHLVARVWRRLIGSPPLPDRQKTLAASWKQHGLSLPWLMEAVQQSPEADRSRRKGQQLADPLEVVIRSLRLLGSRHPEALELSLRGLKAMGQAPFEPPNVGGWPVNEQWLNLRGLNARKRTLLHLVRHEEIWETRSLPKELDSSLTARSPLTLTLPASASREHVALLFADPVWQLR